MPIPADAPAVRFDMKSPASRSSRTIANAAIVSGRGARGHGSYLTFPRMGVRLKGDAKGWDIVAGSDNVKTRAFCPVCG